jgi:hypothetical protein
MTSRVYVRFFRANPDRFDHVDALQRLDALPLTDRYLARPYNRQLFAKPLENNGGIGLWAIRGDLPDVHVDGDIKPWDLPGEVAEGSYFGFCPGGIVAMAPSGHGPRTTALSAYFDEITDDDVVFDPIVRNATSAYVASLDEIKRIELGVTAPSIRVLKEVDDSLGQALDDLRSATGAGKIGVVLGGDEDERHSLWDRMRGPFRDLASRDDLTMLKKAKLVVRGELGGSEDIDLIKDRVAYHVAVPASGLDKDNALTVIGQAYDRYRADYHHDDSE